MASAHSTSRETEIKLRIDDLPALIRRLNALGCRCRGSAFQRNSIYDTPSEEYRRCGRLLRVRSEVPVGSRFAPGRTVITSKAPLPVRGTARFKEKLERELVVRPRMNWDLILRSLGLRARFVYEKYRTFYRHKGLHLDLDETPVGTFLELEGRPATIDRCARALGFSRSDYIRSTYWDLLQENNRRTGRNSRHMRFAAKKLGRNRSQTPLFA